MTDQPLDLSQLFGSATAALMQNQSNLNQADPYNHDHGNNMVDTFQTITQALQQKSGASPSTQLAYASKVLSAQGNSGSSQMYADNLSQAAQQFRGQQVTGDNVTQLIQILLGSQMAAPSASDPSAGDPMSSILGSLMGGGQMGDSTSAGAAAQDPLGGLLGSLIGGGSAQSGGQSSGGLDLNTLLSAGMAYMQARQQGGNPLEAVAGALVSGSQMSNQPHHAQSGQVVATALIQAATAMLGRK